MEVNNKNNVNQLGIFYKYHQLLSFASSENLDYFKRAINKIDGFLINYQIPLVALIGNDICGKAVEVGCWKGKTTLAFRFMCNPYLELFSVDHFEGSKEHKEMITGINLFEEFKGNMEKYKILSTIIKKPSIEAAKDFKDLSLECVFIDAGHDYEDVKSDILAWSPKLKSNGLLIGHDYPDLTDDKQIGFEGLVKAVDEQVKNSKKFQHFGYYQSLWGARKI